ncbi:MAG: hypothetical protein AB7O97_08265 [Planctomycetota bacterium]
MLQRNVTPGFYVSPNATREEYGFDDLGRLDSIATDAYGTAVRIVQVDFEHDSLNRLLEESFQYYGTGTSTFDVTSDYSYGGSQPIGDPAVRRGLGYPGGFQVETVPDPLGRLEEVKLTPNGSTQFTLAQYRYAGASVFQRELWLGSTTSVTTQKAFDDHGRLAELHHQQGSDTFDRYRYTWNDADDLVRKRRDYAPGSTASSSLQTAGELFQYDGFHRLTGAKQGVDAAHADGAYAAATGTGSFAKEFVYGLDPGQNRSSVVVNTPSAMLSSTVYETETDSSRYTKAEGVEPLYDAEGKLVFDGAKYFKYDFRNRLSEVYGVYQTGSSSSALSSGGTQGTELTASQARRVRVADLETGRAELRGRARGNDIAWARGLGRASSQRVSSAITASGEGGAGEGVVDVQPAVLDVAAQGLPLVEVRGVVARADLRRGLPQLAGAPAAAHRPRAGAAVGRAGARRRRARPSATAPRWTGAGS